MADFKVVLPTTTEEWQRDMNLAYNQALEDMQKGIKEILEDNAIYNIDCIDTLVKQLSE